MTAVRPFDPAESLGPGRTIVEASAGTGKTFTIAAAVTRLVADAVPLQRILVVTFTRAATAELKGRVRGRMVDTLAALEGRPVTEIDRHLQVLLDLEAPERKAAADRLHRALTEFDRAQIFTIHGFAQRLLGQLGFRVRLPETLEPGEVDDLLLSQVASDLSVARFFRSGPDDPNIPPRMAARLGMEVIEHPDAGVVPDPGQVSGEARLRVEMATAVAAETRRRMRLTGAMTFDDGLIEVRDALADPAVGEAATELLRRRYDIGLVDESQDTDPIQWQIIRRIFDDSRLVVIGDPKQSIYAFRGADIESYLAAVRGASAHRTLAINWRSDGPLVAALDVLFAGTTFGDEAIAYRPVTAAYPEARLRGLSAPLRLRLVASDLDIACRQDGFYLVGDCRQAVADDVANEVVRLLDGSITVPEKDRTLGPADIAVLCRTRSQVEWVRECLGTRGVPSVAARNGSVLITTAAEDWRRFLMAVERPDRLGLVRMAATTCLVGMPLSDLAALDDEDALDLQRRMRGWHDSLQVGGVPTLLAELNRDTNLTGRILAEPDGERLLTDLVHIAEEMHAASRRGRQGSLTAWLETAMQEAAARDARRAEEPDSRQRRLETDADAVTVQTIHAAKGLQYPVVLVPYAWDVPSGTPDFPVFHEPGSATTDTPRRRLIDVGGPDWPGFAQNRDLAEAEDADEENRLLYVSLTRAQHHLEVWWVENHAAIDRAKITELLTGEGRTPAGLAAASNGTIEVSTLTGLPGHVPYRPQPRVPVELEVARFARTTDPTWRRVSFSSLSADQPLTPADERAEHLPRADETETLPEGEAEPVVAAPLLPLAELPAGARFGTLVHDVLERVRFDDPGLEGALTDLVTTETTRTGWDFDTAGLTTGLVQAIATPLGPEDDAVTLADLEAGGLARELVFELPVCTGHDPVTLADIGAVMADHLAADDPYRAYVDHLLAATTLPFRGFMSGAIDLVGVLPDNRYIVMDYKTNALPAVGPVAGPADYGPSILAGEMVSHRYVLQATLYQVALHRYLQWRLPGYDPAANLGGSRYLFVRGMIGPDTPVIDGERCGVTRWQPPPEMIVSLSDLLAGGGS
ncbi:MAG TPA: UvrD-helicase domain-containing protein [Acidimicrobiia bacterium]|nr:UvrD-helicase domain-containing protein [Acidimicrobiia bacterium]